jgi:hypothetical protein
VTVIAGTNIPTAVVGSWFVTGNGSGYITVAGTGFTVADSGVISVASTLKGATGTTSAQSVPPTITVTAVARTAASSTITVTTAAPHQFTTSTVVKLDGLLKDDVDNLTGYTVASVPTPYTFTVTGTKTTALALNFVTTVVPGVVQPGVVPGSAITVTPWA